MRLLITTDAVGGVWTYTKELTLQLAQRGHEICLVCFGPAPNQNQKDWIGSVRALTFHAAPYKLEWMHDCRQDLEDSREELLRVIHQFKPDLLHSNQFCFGSLDCRVPKIVVAHSDVVSWWHAIHGCDPEPVDFPHADFYRDTVCSGIASADTLVGITRWMLSQIPRHYISPRRSVVIYNGRDPRLFAHDSQKQHRALTVGRLWDKAKNIALIERTQTDVPVYIAGESSQRTERYLGQLTEDQLRVEYARARVYVSPALYEPFGLAPLEAAFSNCALLLSDIPTFREIWGDHATYFNPREPHEMALRLCADLSTRNVRDHALAHYTSDRMAEQYLSLYATLTGRMTAAA
ncbi:MAG: glycosyltransferase family 4 protein [Acidobacteriaceae bacterium]